LFKKLDPVLNIGTRIAIMSVIIKYKRIDFRNLKKKTKISSGNLSTQTRILNEAGYITIEKSRKNNYPRTIYILTNLGEKRFEIYNEYLLSYIKWLF
jgi:DNA-binding HxlR family transcriptional regulator